MTDSNHHHNEDCHGHHHDDDHDHHHHDHNHSHSHSHSHVPSDTKSLMMVIAITAGYMVVELVVGFYANSLALLGDALHMLTDVSALLLAAFTLWLARRPSNDRYTFGYSRAESIGAMANSMFLLFLTTLVLYSAIGRLREPPHVESTQTLFAGIGGLVANLLSAFILHRSGQHSLAIRGAFLHVVSDALGSIGVIISAIVMERTGWLWTDPIASMLISVLVTIGAVRLLRDSISHLMDERPQHLNVKDIEDSLKTIEGVSEVHDVHVWSHGIGKVFMTAHLVVPSRPFHQTLCEAQDLVAKKFQIRHSTIQIEQSDLHDDCREAKQ